MNKGADGNYASLINKAGVTESLEVAPSTQSARIEVIPKMDSVYADLVRYQMELEQKNSALEEAQQFIGSVLSSMTDALIVCDTEGKIQKVNGALEKLTGKPAETFMQCPLGEVDANVEEPRLLQRRRDLKIDRIMEDMGPLIDGTLEGAERVSDIVQDLRRYSSGQKEQRSRFELPLFIEKAVQ